MQNTACSDDLMHIITASNANKKLFFQGWKKSVEAFSQGKGSLSHRCTSILTQLDTSCHDEAISWSSSEGEEDKPISLRIRPNRTLTSQINFDDCKRVHSRGRRHSSAQFVRSVEKHLKCGQIKTKVVLSPQVTEPVNNPNSSHFEEPSVNALESFDETNWVNNLSILNKRINLSLDNASLLSSEKSIDDIPILSPSKGSQENKATSPIFVSRKSKSLKKKKWNTPQKPKSEINEENLSRQPSSDLPPSSPVFKIISHRRRSSHKNPQGSFVKSNIRNNNISAHVSTSNPCSSSKTTSGLCPESAAFMAPVDLDKVSDTSLSPVLGKSSGKRRRPMAVDTLISPILGSKTKTNRPLKIQRSIPKSQVSCKLLQSSDNFNTSLPSSTCEGSPTGINSGKTYKMSNSTSSEIFATAKRSLNFSVQSDNARKENLNCDTRINNNTETSRQNYSQIECEKNTCGFQNNTIGDIFSCQNVSLSTVNSAGLGCSQLIEEINTEQINVSPVSKPAESPDHIKKKKKLSLSKKEVSKQSTTETKRNVKWSVNLMEVEVGQTSEEHVSNNNHFSVSQSRQNQAVQNMHSFDKKERKPDNILSTNYTLHIEEENSEPIKFVSQEVLPSPTNFKINSVSKNHSLSLHSLNEITDKTDSVEDGDIDSCSSQSPENSQLTQIEKLPSSCVSSPLTISQTSSPMAPTVVSGLSAEIVHDDFNAPPKTGKKKLKVDGLASRLQRALNRHRSSSRIWQFKRSKESRTICASNVNTARNSSMALVINHTWVEYSHVIIQGCIEADMSTGSVPSRLSSLSNQVVLVLDPYIAGKVGKIMSAQKIRVFPPWQALKVRGISLILCAYCIEVIEVDSSKPIRNSFITGQTISVPVEEGFEHTLGASLSDIIFPQIVEKPTCLFQCTETNCELDLNEGIEGPASGGTISSLVSKYYVGATFDAVNLKILRAFQFRQADSEQISSNYPSWSLLGQDVTGEMCEILIGCEQSSALKSIWPNIKTGHIIGQVISFVGFVPVQRISPFRVSSLWRVVSNISAEPCEQPVFYVFAASSSQHECKILNSEKQLDKVQVHFTSLSKILIEEVGSNHESTRVNIICRSLNTTSERLYVTDTEVSPNIMVISVNPTAFLSPEVFKASVLVILDLEVVSGALRIDKYTRISILGAESSSSIKNFYNAELYHGLADLNPTLPHLQTNSSSKSLAIFTGTIVGIDEDSAYMWPACGICENELLSLGDNSEKYRCEKCNDQCDNFILRMSLQVLCSCVNLPPKSSVRLKLLQKTIEMLLPSTLVGEEGYDMNTVLGQKLGPLRCEVISVKEQNFTLQELPNLP